MVKPQSQLLLFLVTVFHGEIMVNNGFYTVRLWSIMVFHGQIMVIITVFHRQIIVVITVFVVKPLL